MDEAQKKIAIALKENKNCLKDATMLKNVLADAIPGDKIHSNLMMNAYNEGIFKCFFEKDPTLSLLQFVPVLVNNYGISEQNAVWSVITWCYVFSRIEIANALLSLKVQDSLTSSLDSRTSANNHSSEIPDTGAIDAGMYKAGVDFPVGTVRIKVEFEPPSEEDGQRYQIWCGTGKKTNNIDTNQSIRSQSYVETKNGDYVLFDNIGNYPLKRIIYEKIN